MNDSVIWTALFVGYLLTWLLIPKVLLKRTVHTSSAVAWILSIIFLPYLGPLLFTLFGSVRFEKRRARKREASAIINRQLPEWSERYEAAEEEVGDWAGVAHLASELTGSKLLLNNDIKLLPDTKQTLELIEEVVNAAEQWVHIEFYIWRQDKAGTHLRDLLVRKAREGLQVRFLYDGIGSMFLSRGFLQPMEEAGVSIASFTAGFELWHPGHANLRNHRKIVVADGHTGFTGGMNIGDEHIRRTDSYGNWRDTQLRIRGPAVLQLQQVFAQDWYYATGEALTASEFYPSPVEQGRVPCQVVADGPDNDVDTYYSLMLAALGQARHRVTLTTPYFVPPDGLAMALETAALRGVKVRIMVAGRGNFVWTLRAGRSYYDSLLRAGTEIYEYQDGLFHPKTLTVDGYWSLVGTPNCDFRSFYLNFEVALASFDQEVAAALEADFERDCKHADRINWKTWQQRPTTTVLQEKFWRLFAPIL